MEHTAYRSSAASSSPKWYYMNGGKKCGPVDESKLVSMLSSGTLGPDTRVWTKGMDSWSPASNTELMNQIDTPTPSPVVVNLNTGEEPAPKKKSRWWIWLIVGILALGIAVACFFLFFQKEEEPVEIPPEPVITYGLEDPVIFENDKGAFYIDAVGEKGDYLELDVRCVNKTAGPLVFVWNSTSVNGSMFDPLWEVSVLGNTTMKSSITFPLNTLEEHNLLPADEIKFILRVYSDVNYDHLRSESSQHIVAKADITSKYQYRTYREIKEYNGYLFSKDVKVDEAGRPYYVDKDKQNIYFDEIYDLNGNPIYPIISEDPGYPRFYNDKFGRPYYFNSFGDTIYYDGCGFAFSDLENGKNYFYNEDGKPVYYGNDGIPEYYAGTVTQELLNAGKPHALEKAGSTHVMHKEFTIYPTGKTAEEVTYPNRIFASSELTYWDGEKGNFIVLGGTMDEFSGYIVHTYIENKSDNYILFGYSGAVVNGVSAFSNATAVLRPHSRIYRDVTVPISMLKENKINDVEEIKFRVYAVGENLSVPLYPITWEARTLAGVTD